MYTLHHGNAVDVLRTLPADSVRCCITSPPYRGLRRYLPHGHPLEHLQIGLEPTIGAHLAALVEVFREVRRVLHPRGILWVNYGNMYANDGGSGRGGGGARVGRSHQQENNLTGVPAGYKPKDLILMDAMLAMALQADGWWLRSEIIWHKPTAMPESAADRPMRDHEKLFLFSKGAHFATFPPRLPERCVLLASKPGDLILDPFCGAGTTGLVALRHGRRFVGIDVNESYLQMARERFERERWMWCLEFLAPRVPHQTPRSACVFCPYRRDAEWAHLKQTDPAGWQRAIEIDRALRTPGAVVNRDMRQQMYLHESRQPLELVQLDPKPVAHKWVQLSMSLNSECEGVCGV